MWRLKELLHKHSLCSSSSTKTSNKPQHPRSTTTSPAPSPTSKATTTVLQTPELLELILTHLTPTELLLAQRVSRRWHSVILSSLPLRRRLYLSPSPGIDPDIPIDNPWLKGLFPDLGVYLLQGNPKWRPRFVQALDAADYATLMGGGGGRNSGGKFLAEPKASWRDMLLTQPPIRELTVYANVEEEERDERTEAEKKRSRSGRPPLEGQRQASASSVEEMMRSSVALADRNGITMGMVVDAGLEARRRGAVAAKRRLTDRKDSGYISMDGDKGGDGTDDEIEVVVVEVED